MMPSVSRSTGSYNDIKQVLDYVNARGSVTLSFDKRSRATVWTTRANKLRVLMRQNSLREGGREESPYDNLLIRAPRQQGEFFTIEICPRPVTFVGIFDTATGEPIPLDTSNPALGPQLSADAEDEAFLASFETPAASASLALRTEKNDDL